MFPEGVRVQLGLRNCIEHGKRTKHSREYVQLPWPRFRFRAPRCFDRHDSMTLKAAVIKRLFRDHPPPSDVHLDGMEELGKKVAVELLDPCPPLTEEQRWQIWISQKRKSYSAYRISQLARCRQRNHFNHPTLGRAQKVAIHVKDESYMLSDKAPRAIMARNDYVKCWYGPIVHQMELKIWNLTLNGKPVFVKHLNTQQKAALILSNSSFGRYIYEIDFSAFESQIIDEVMMSIEFGVIEWLTQYMLDEEQVNFIESFLTMQQKLKSRDGFRALCYALRMSGEMDTSVMNSWVNFIVVSYVAMKSEALMQPLFEGDDGLVATDKPLDGTLFAKCGFTVKLVPREQFYLASFCGMYVSTDGNVIREPQKVLVSFGWTNRMVYASDTVHMELLRCKSLSLLSDLPRCPILTALALKGLALTSEYSVRKSVIESLKDGYHEYHFEPETEVIDHTISMQTRVCFAHLFGISVDVQLKCEESLTDGNVALFEHYLPPPPPVIDYALHYTVVE